MYRAACMTIRVAKQYLIVAMLALATTSCDRAQPPPEDPLTTLGQQLGFTELELLGKIKTARSPAERERLIAELEATPELIHPYYSRWLVLHDVTPFQCWTEQGYDPSLSDVPRDIQLLAATNYGLADIENGGLHQFFSNGTGAFAPEMVEWFKRADMPEAAQGLQQAMDLFGKDYPRSQSARQEFLDQFTGETREQWDPFYEIEKTFYPTVGRTGPDYTDPHAYVEAANKWLREVCGITDLRMEYVPVQGNEAERK